MFSLTSMETSCKTCGSDRETMNAWSSTSSSKARGEDPCQDKLDIRMFLEFLRKIRPKTNALYNKKIRHDACFQLFFTRFHSKSNSKKHNFGSVLCMKREELYNQRTEKLGKNNANLICFQRKKRDNYFKSCKKTCTTDTFLY